MTELVQHIEQVAQYFWGEPNTKLSKPGKEIRFGTHGSKSIDLEKGTWYDHEQNEGGGVSDLIKKETGGAKIEAWMSENLGIHLTPRASKTEDLRPIIPRRIKEVYPYVNAYGEIVYEVLRFEPKDFRQRRLENGKHVWNLQGVTPLPYNLPAILEHPRKTIFLVEGEKDVEALKKLGLLASCNSGGAKKWTQDLNQHFAGRKIIVLPDNDEAGRNHAKVLVEQLASVAQEVRILELPNLKEKADVFDWIQDGGSKDQLVQLAKVAPLAKDWQAPVSPPRLRILTLKEIADLPPVTWLVNGLIPKQSLAMIYGEPGGGKTFTALDIALTVAHGAQWHGHEVTRGQVFYVAGEGVGGFRKRIGAWHLHHEREEQAPFFLIPKAVNLLDDNEILDLLQTIETTRDPQIPVAMVIFDTVARCMIGGDENSAQDMGKAVKNMDLVREALGCAVLPIHHSGKDSNRGARGSTALIGAVDVSIKVERDNDRLLLTTEKQKDAEPLQPMQFKTISVELATGPLSLEAETSLVLEATDQPADIVARKKLSGQQRLILDALHDALANAGEQRSIGNYIPKGYYSVSESLWRDFSMSKQISDGSDDSKKKAFLRAAKALQERGIVGKWDDYCWIWKDKHEPKL
jgi:RecA/RadA recombinase